LTASAAQLVRTTPSRRLSKSSANWNGKAEAFIKTLDRELLARRTFASLDDLQAALDRYLTFYNNYRLHSSLGWQPPVTRYAGRPIAV
jgi:transposase InsO family protein